MTVRNLFSRPMWSLVSCTSRLRSSDLNTIHNRTISTARVGNHILCGPMPIDVTTRQNYKSYIRPNLPVCNPGHIFTMCLPLRHLSSVRNKPKEPIQSILSPLQVTGRRPARRRKDRDQPGHQETFSVMTYSSCEEIDLETLRQAVEKKGVYDVCQLPKDLPDAMYLRAAYRVEEEPREIFVFREGSIAYWNVPGVERSEFLRFISRYQTDVYSSELVETEVEDMVYNYGEGTTRVEDDEITIDKNLPADDVILRKYTFSNALSLSVKLNIWEASLEGYIESIETITEDLTRGVVNGISRSAALKKTGELLTLRHLINLSSDLLDTPDFYWDRQELEKLYTKMCADLCINKRTRVMNEKINCCVELMSLLRTDLNDQHHTRLEWMIIILILVEVIFEVVHHLERENYSQQNQNPGPDG